MKPLANFIGVALVGAFALLAAPTAQAQVGVNINIGAPAWGPQVPYGTQYYYIPEIDGYYDLYTQQYIVFQDGYWVPLPQLYGYDPYQFHPVIVDYRGAQPWLRVDYYRQRYAYQPYRNYGPTRGSYYNGGYGHPGYGYGNRGYDNRGYSQGNAGYSRPREDGRSQSPGNYGGGRPNQPQGFPQQGQPNPGQQSPGGFGHSNGGDRSHESQGPQGGSRNDGGGRGGRGGNSDGRGGNNGGGRGRH